MEKPKKKELRRMVADVSQYSSELTEASNRETETDLAWLQGIDEWVENLQETTERLASNMVYLIDLEKKKPLAVDVDQATQEIEKIEQELGNYSCPSCDWTGTKEEMKRECYRTEIEYCCPVCNSSIVQV